MQFSVLFNFCNFIFNFLFSMSVPVAAGKASAVAAGTVQLTKERLASALTWGVPARVRSSWVADDVQLIYLFLLLLVLLMSYLRTHGVP